jgi:hypothetical protein
VAKFGEFSLIGRLFTLGSQFLENFRSSPHSTATLSRDARYELILTKNGLGIILGYFFLTHLVTLKVSWFSA